MDKLFQKEVEGIYRLKIPFDDLYTSVFLISTDGGYALVDCATTADDADEWIEPALKREGLSFLSLACVIVTHEHGDHAGGLSRILQKNPRLRVIRKAEKLNGLEIYPLSGHTTGFIGVFDRRSGTLISGDGLQGAGVGKYPCSLESADAYLQSIEKIKQDGRVENLLFSHAYEPWYRDSAFGREAVENCLKDCLDYVKRRN